MSDFAKKNPLLVIKGGVYDGQIFDERGVTDLANMPTLPELYGKLVFTIQSPVQRVAGGLSNLLQRVVVCVRAYGESRDS